MNGVLMPITRSMRSGNIRGAFHAVSPPQSWPTMMHLSMPKASSIPMISVTIWLLRVRLDRLRAIGVAVAALVGRDRAKTRIGERANLMTPRIPEFREAMAHHDGDAAAGLDQMHPDAVGVYKFMIEFAHEKTLPRR